MDMTFENGYTIYNRGKTHMGVVSRETGNG